MQPSGIQEKAEEFYRFVRHASCTQTKIEYKRMKTMKITVPEIQMSHEFRVSHFFNYAGMSVLA